MLKRILPFILTLALGLALAGWARKNETRLGPGGGGPAAPCFQRLEQSGALGEDPSGERIFKVREVTQRARILLKPAPQYTEEARRNEVSGTVMLRVVLSSTGHVANMRVVSGLPYGLTENALEAARRIEFVPAVKDGRYVSQQILVEYNFNMY